jgi:hypothetical protein
MAHGGYQADMSYDLNIMGLPNIRRALLRVDNTAIEGPQKLIQRMLVLLFTDLSEPTNLGYGTNLPQDAIGNITNVEVLVNTYNLALARVTETLLAETPSSAPDNEKLSNVQVKAQETETEGQMEVFLDVTTLAGDTVTVSVPVITVTEQEDGN